MTPPHISACGEACGEACVDEIAHLPPAEAGQALGYAASWLGIDLERTAGDGAALAFYTALEDRCRDARLRLEGYMQREKETNP